VRADADATKLQGLQKAHGISRRKTKKPIDRLRFIGFSVHCTETATRDSTRTYDTEESEWTPQWTPGIQSGGIADASPELAEIVAAWPQMPEHIKAAVLALVRTGVAKDRG